VPITPRLKIEKTFAAADLGFMKPLQTAAAPPR